MVELVEHRLELLAVDLVVPALVPELALAAVVEEVVGDLGDVEHLTKDIGNSELFLFHIIYYQSKVLLRN